ncbi:MAG: efflux RND transporter periplasmic adaptor subunit [Proteobacteria bacterium]|nr:efflux RND transporter periplasmic adaptor subunit [Pseudomonadota bacterium]MBU1057204.1 efflux RND transporter periplasmic adaptor subunit [Pseudomonadota bacterium]
MRNASLRFFIVFSIFLLLWAGGAGAVAAQSGAEHQHDSEEQAAAGTVETVWTCSMHPQIRLPESGQCPICFMDLIEIKKESGADRQSLRQISFDERARRMAQVEVQPVVRGNTAREVRMVGKVDYDETRVGTITSWVNGRIDKLFVDYTGSHVRRGQAMARVYSPELLSAQAELIQASSALQRAEHSSNEIIKKTAARTLEASREKLRLLGLGDEQLRGIEQQGKPTEHLTLIAPLSGIVIKKDVNEGMYVKTGSPIYTVADLDQVWVILEAYESDIQAIALGQQVHFTVESYPGTSFQGEVAYIDSLVDDKSRTVRVRLNVINVGAKLKPGMFVRATSSSMASDDPGRSSLLIPASAPLVTGKRALVYVQLPNEKGVYVGREVILGQRRGEFYQVHSGLKEGELVVTRGNFKIDSAIQLQGRPSLMNPYREEVLGVDTSLPLLFVSRLNLLNRSFAKLSQAFHGGDVGQQKATLTQFSTSLNRIKEDNLPKKDLLSWLELSMLLRSDLILLQEAEGSRETKHLYGTMAEHFHQLRNRFALNDVAATRLGSVELREKISLLLTRYFVLQQDLAADNLEAALADSASLSPPADAVIAGLQETGFEQVNSFVSRLTKDIHLLGGAETLAEMRTFFYSLSLTLAQVVETFGSVDDVPIYVQFCPMAFDNKGATWLAPSEEISNPYFGAMMLRCGEVRQQITE